VLVDAPHPAFSGFVIDDVLGGELATSHLVELGHRRIAFVGDKPPDPFRFASSRDRTRGYELALAHAGIERRPEYVREGTQNPHVARSIAIDLLRLPQRPTAIFAASDAQALGVLEAARILGIRVPEELSVVGFDDVEVASYVGLTTVRQPLYDSGRRGAQLLLQLLSGEEPPGEPRTEQLPLEVVVRSTTAEPPS
jgi:DNA-binding LacI/PurR family transcriptional regulator